MSSCAGTSSSRILAHQSRYDDVLNAMAAKYSALRAGPALSDLNGVLVGAIQGFTEEEWGKARSQARNNGMETHASRSGLAGALTSVMAQGRGPDELRLEQARSQAVTQEQMSGAAPLAIPERGLVLLVGDESVIGGPLREAGMHYERVTVPE